MSLISGSQIGPYQITNLMATGGMGEVYRARDPRLRRDVAIKVLPLTYSTDADRLRRFEQEARAVGLLNHPNIVTIYDVGTHDGAPYLVTELLEGETLRERLKKSALPKRKAVDYANQIASGLAAAHDKGIIHRDLKPENIFITKDGRIKILDFGLAKLIRNPASDSQSNILTGNIGTEAGMIVGTVGYMSPEQVRGLETDHRTDIFALGAILYEMLSRERAFSGDSAADITIAILRDEPPELSKRIAGIPPALEQLVRHCLEKNVEERFQSSRDLAFNLQAISGFSDTMITATTQPAAPSKKIPIFSVLILLGALAAGFFAGRYTRQPLNIRHEIQVSRLTDFSGLEEGPAISPDGKTVAFTANVGGKSQIWVRLLSGGSPLQVTRDPTDHQFPRWSPDSSSLIYYSPPLAAESQGTISEISALGGVPRRISSAIGGGDISHDGHNYTFFRFNKDKIELVTSTRDGSNTKVIKSFALGKYYLYPRWSPNDNYIAFQSGSVFDWDIFIVGIDGGEIKNITNEGTLLNGFSWVKDGPGIVYSTARDSTMLYLPTFNLCERRLDEKITRPVTFGESSYTNPDVNSSGAMVACRTHMKFDIWKIPVAGNPADNTQQAMRITQQTGQVQTPSPSPNDKEIVYLSDNGGHANLWVIQPETGETHQLTYEKDPKVAVGVPVWSPDGKQIAFVSTRNNPTWQVGLWLVNPDGSNIRNVVRLGGWATWSSDSKWLYYTEIPVGWLKKMPAFGGTPITVRKEQAGRSALSPDGGTLYYTLELPTMTGSSDFEIRAASPESAPSRLLIRIPSTRVPLWQLFHPVISPDGKSLVLPLTDGVTTNIWSLSTDTGELRQLTDFETRATFIARRISWSADGKSVFAAVGEGDADVVLLRRSE
jgi:eukaryotic-like serine/threonine-protein kinase